jgi:hypothetical protein
MEAAANTLISTFFAFSEDAEDLDLEADAEDDALLLPQDARDSAMHSARTRANSFFMQEDSFLLFINFR